MLIGDGFSTGVIAVSRRNVVQDMARSYDVYVDGEIVGRVKPYRTARFTVSAGPHRVWARLAGTGDAAMGDVVIDVPPGNERRVCTTSRLKRIPPWEMFRAVIDTLLLRRGFVVDVIPRVLLRANPILPEDSAIQDLDLPRGNQTPEHNGSLGLIRPTSATLPLAQTIRDVAFATERRGYQPAEVDAHFEHLAALADSGVRLTHEQVIGTNFKQALNGYNRAQVDAFLQALAAQI